jgi:hypothetical protein
MGASDLDRTIAFLGGSIMEPRKAGRLLGPDGRPNLGIFDGPLTDLSLDAFRPHGQKKASHAQNEFMKDCRLKRWQFCGVAAEDFILGAAVVDIGYLSNAFAYLFDRKSGRMTEYSANQALAAKTAFDAIPTHGHISFKAGQASFEMLNGQVKSA